MTMAKRARLTTMDSSKSVPYIHDDLVFKILIRLPAECLLRFKTVCKNWRTMIEQDDFVLSHSVYAPIVPFIPDDNHAVVAYCDGVVLEQNLTSKKKLRVRNPCLRLVLDLPYPSKTSSMMNFAYDGQFKLISFYDNKGGKGCQVLTFNEDNLSWKTVPAPPDFSNKKVLRGQGDGGVVRYFWTDTMNGKSSSGRNFKIGVESFDLKNEYFISSSCMYPPDSFRNFHKVNALFWYERLLVCAIDMDKMELHATVLVDLETSKWSDKMTFALSLVGITKHDEYIFRSDDVEDIEVRVDSYLEVVTWAGGIGKFMIKKNRMLPRLPRFNLRHTLLAHRGMQPETKTTS